MPKVLQTQGKSDILYNVRDGFLICPICRRNKRLLKISPETKAHGLIVYCRIAKMKFGSTSTAASALRAGASDMHICAVVSLAPALLSSGLIAWR